MVQTIIAGAFIAVSVLLGLLNWYAMIAALREKSTYSFLPPFLPGVIGLSKKTMEVIRQNFTASIVVNSVGLMLASMGVLPVFWAAVLHNATTIAVVLNSGRILITDISKEI